MIDVRAGKPRGRMSLALRAGAVVVLTLAFGALLGARLGSILLPMLASGFVSGWLLAEIWLEYKALLESEGRPAK